MRGVEARQGREHSELECGGHGREGGQATVWARDGAGGEREGRVGKSSDNLKQSRFDRSRK